MAAAAAVAATRSSVRRLQTAGTALFVCDIQDRFVPLIYEMRSVIHTSVFLCDIAGILGLPIVATEQYPKGLGHTVPELQEYLTSGGGAHPVVEKTAFSMVSKSLLDDVSKRCLGDSALERVILVGLETHVCVQETALDLLEQGIDVFVVVDGVSSQRPLDRGIALRRMETAGAVLTTAESVCLTILRDAAHPHFKAVSKRLIQRNLDRVFTSLASDGVTDLTRD